MTYTVDGWCKCCTDIILWDVIRAGTPRRNDHQTKTVSFLFYFLKRGCIADIDLSQTNDGLLCNGFNSEQYIYFASKILQCVQSKSQEKWIPAFDS